MHKIIAIPFRVLGYKVLTYFVKKLCKREENWIYQKITKVNTEIAYLKIRLLREKPQIEVSAGNPAVCVDPVIPHRNNIRMLFVINDKSLNKRNSNKIYHLKF